MEGLLQRVVYSCLGKHAQEVSSTYEAGSMAGTYCGVAEGLGQEGLADANGADQEDMLTASKEVQE